MHQPPPRPNAPSSHPQQGHPPHAPATSSGYGTPQGYGAPHAAPNHTPQAYGPGHNPAGSGYPPSHGQSWQGPPPAGAHAPGYAPAGAQAQAPRAAGYTPRQRSPIEKELDKQLLVALAVAVISGMFFLGIFGGAFAAFKANGVRVRYQQLGMRRSPLMMFTFLVAIISAATWVSQAVWFSLQIALGGF